MNFVDETAETLHCFRHPRRETALRCGKCDNPICARCVVQTPVGARCASCAQLKRLPQFDVGVTLVARATAAGFGTSLLGWYLISHAVFLRFFLSFLVGAAVGEVMSRLSRRRTSLALEVAAVAAVVAGLFVVESLRLGTGVYRALDQSVVVGLVFPAIIASFVAVVKLR